MSSEPSEISLKDAVEFIVDNRGKTAPTADTGIALIATNCVNNNDLYPKKLNVRYVSKNIYETWFRAHPLPGDILLTNKGSQNGAICLVPDPVDFCIAQDMVALRADSKKIYPLYLFAALRSEIVQKRIKALNVDAVIPHLKKTDFDKLFIPLLTRNEQQWIGDLYFEMCARIELLRETNATLEAIAQALFKSWFVDFDPVRAKMEGRAPEGMDEATAALFPDSFEETELGMVPRGWRVMPFLEACDLQGGAQPPASTFLDTPRDGYVRLLQIRDFSTDAHKTYIPDTSKLKKATEDDVLLGRYGSASGDKAKDSLGRVCRGLSGSYNVALMKLVPLQVGREFALQLVNDPRFYNYLQGVSSKAVQSGFSKSELGQYKVVVPPRSLADAYEEMGFAFWQRLKHGVARQRELSDIRDTLLPRLISGQVQLPDLQSLE